MRKAYIVSSTLARVGGAAVGAAGGLALAGAAGPAALTATAVAGGSIAGWKLARWISNGLWDRRVAEAQYRRGTIATLRDLYAMLDPRHCRNGCIDVADVGPVELRYTELLPPEGESTRSPLVFVPAYGIDRTLYHRLAARCAAARVHAVFLDHPRLPALNHDREPPIPAAPDLGLDATVLRAFLAHREWHHVTVVGTSLGAGIALEMAAQAQENMDRIGRVVAISPLVTDGRPFAIPPPIRLEARGLTDRGHAEPPSFGHRLWAGAKAFTGLDAFSIGSASYEGFGARMLGWGMMDVDPQEFPPAWLDYLARCHTVDQTADVEHDLRVGAHIGPRAWDHIAIRARHARAVLSLARGQSRLPRTPEDITVPVQVLVGTNDRILQRSAGPQLDGIRHVVAQFHSPSTWTDIDGATHGLAHTHADRMWEALQKFGP